MWGKLWYQIENKLRTVDCLRFLFLLLGFMFFQGLLLEFSPLPESRYFQKSILWSWLQQPANFLLFTGGAVLTFSLRKLSWSNCLLKPSEGSSSFKAVDIPALVLFCAGIVVLPLVLSQANFYYQELYILDRALLLLGLILLALKPSAVFLVLLLSWVFFQQFTWPFGILYPAMSGFPAEILTAFAALLLLKRLGFKGERDMMFLVLVLAASHYWTPGFSKLRMGWLFHNQTQFLVSSAYGSNHLTFLEPETLSLLVEFVGTMNFPIKVFTLTAELGALVFILKAFWGRCLALSWVLMHLGICLLVGICLWQWALVDLFLLAMAFRQVEIWNAPRSSKLLGIFLIATSPWWSQAATLSWFDARANYHYELEAYGQSGQNYKIPISNMEPYGLHFTLGDIRVLSTEPSLDILWSATSKELAKALADAETREEVLAVEKQLAVAHHREEAIEKYRTFLSNFMKQAPGTRPWHIFPPTVLTHSPEKAYRGQEQLDRLEVFQVLGAYTREGYLTLRRRKILVVKNNPSQEQKE